MRTRDKRALERAALTGRPVPAKPRDPSSVRFEPYFKAQWWNPRVSAWQDIQRQCFTPEAARELFKPGRENRIMRISPGGREVYDA